MTDSTPASPRNPLEPAIPSRVDAATAEMFMAMRLGGEGQTFAAVDATRRYVATDPAAALPTSRVSS